MAEQTWTGVIGRLGVPTSDGRIIMPDGFTTRTLPLPLSWQQMSDYGHDKSVVVGRIDTITPDPATGLVNASGVFLDPSIIPEVGPAMELVRNKVVGPSMDAGACEMEYRVTGGGEGTFDDDGYHEPEPWGEVCVFTSYECAGATLVNIPAFTGVSLSLGAMSLVASVRSEGWSDMPVAPADTEWDGAAAADRVEEWATTDGETDWSKYARAFLHQDDDADPDTKGAYGFGVADIVDGELTIVPKAVYAVAGALSGARGGTTIPEADQERMQSVVRSLYGHLADALDDDSIEAPFALVASAGPQLPPGAWFDNPGLTALTPVTITADGRVFGHAAPWDFPHIGLPGYETCPRSRTGYAYFMLGATMTDRGEIATGKLTVGGGHAGMQDGFTAATEHYDNVGTCVATVTAGEDEFGIWVAGAIVAGATPEQVEALRQSPLSGDWRDIGGNLEAVAFHAVNTPGFPVPRARAVVASGGRCFSLVAAAPRIEAPGAAPVQPTVIDDPQLARLADRIADRLAGLNEGMARVRELLPVVAGGEPSGLRAELASQGVAWPTISARIGGVDFGPYEVAEACVQGMIDAGFSATAEEPAVNPVQAMYAARLTAMKEGIL